jgi:hypothetical protein
MYKVTESGVYKAVESWCVTIPLYDNDGQQFDEALVDSILQEVLLSYPGFSIVNIIGYWRGSDRTYIDNNCQVIIDTVPENISDSSTFFATLKKDLQTRLGQEKIYVTKQDSKQELLSFAEFFVEIGVQTSSHSSQEASQIAKQLVNNIDFALQRLGYETTLLRRDHANNKIIWERKLCGVKIKSEFNDTHPDVKIIAADQFVEIGDALVVGSPFILIGTYEFQTYILEKRNHYALTEVDISLLDALNNPYCLSQSGEPLSAPAFVENFTMSVFVNCIILRDEGFLPKEIHVNVGSDGSMQRGTSEIGSILLHCPAVIPDEVVQKEIIRCLETAVNNYEHGTLNPIAVLQAKAKNLYVFKRAFVRKTLRDIRGVGER